MEDKCTFDLAWRGPCGKPAVANHRCEEHQNEKCVSCGALATHQCSETGPLVCGYSLCDDCEHTIVLEGHNGMYTGQRPEGLGEHCKKSQQKYKPWYMRRRFTHKVIDMTYHEDEYGHDAYCGDLEECHKFLEEQGHTVGYEIVPLLKEEMEALDRVEALIKH